MKRCLCIISSLDAGGAETFLMKICRVLPAEEYQFDFVVSKENGVYSREVLERGGKIFFVPTRSKQLFSALLGIKSIVRNNQYNCVLKLGENSLSVLDLIAAKFGGAHSLALRSCNAPTGLKLKAKLVHGLFRPLLNNITTVKLAPSQLAAEFMFGKSADVKLLNNGVDLSVFRFYQQDRNKIREEFGLSKKLVVGHVGRFHNQKNHRYLLEVFKEIRRQRADAILMLVGTGILEEQIRGWIQEMELQSDVILMGQRFDIPQLMSAMDVFVFPSLYEGMPNTVIEAQATGLPCVIADTITREANITGLVQYLSLNNSALEWAKVAINTASLPRKNTADDFRRHGYDIECVAKELVVLLGLDVDSVCKSEGC